MRKAIVGLVVAAAILAGCGGGDSSISKQEYDQELELVCNKGLQEREELVNRLSREYEERKKQSNTKVNTENIRSLIAVYQGTTEAIADIGLPEEDEKKAEELVQEREKAAEKVEADPLGSLGPLTFEKVTKAAEDLNAKSCGA